jgi:hypothetical protein
MQAPLQSSEHLEVPLIGRGQTAALQRPAPILRPTMLNRDQRPEPLTLTPDVANDDTPPLCKSPVETWLSRLRSVIAMVLIAVGGILTMVWTGFLGWFLGRALYLW